MHKLHIFISYCSHPMAYMKCGAQHHSVWPDQQAGGTEHKGERSGWGGGGMGWSVSGHHWTLPHSHVRKGPSQQISAPVQEESVWYCHQVCCRHFEGYRWINICNLTLIRFRTLMVSCLHKWAIVAWWKITKLHWFVQLVCQFFLFCDLSLGPHPMISWVYLLAFCFPSQSNLYSFSLFLSFQSTCPHHLLVFSSPHLYGYHWQ